MRSPSNLLTLLRVACGLALTLLSCISIFIAGWRNSDINAPLVGVRLRNLDFYSVEVEGRHRGDEVSEVPTLQGQYQGASLSSSSVCDCRGEYQGQHLQCSTNETYDSSPAKRTTSYMNGTNLTGPLIISSDQVPLLLLNSSNGTNNTCDSNITYLAPLFFLDNNSNCTYVTSLANVTIQDAQVSLER